MLDGPLQAPLTFPLRPINSPVAPGTGGGGRPPVGYAFILQNNKIVMQAGKPVVRKVS